MNTFPHSLVTLGESRSQINKERARCGLILGKHCHLPLPHFIKQLIDSGFELHTSCSEEIHLKGLTNHGRMSPTSFALLLRKMAFVVGLGHPLDSTTPLEALANGAAWLNSVSWHETDRENVKRSSSQHQGLKLLGMPYVYNVVLSNATSVLNAAESAVANRFHSFVPFWNRVESVSAQACANLLESDAMCDCAKSGSVGRKIDCRGNFYATNSDLVEDHGILFSPTK